MLKQKNGWFQLGEWLDFKLEEKDSVHFKALTPEGGGVRISREEAREIAEQLFKMVAILDAELEEANS